MTPMGAGLPRTGSCTGALSADRKSSQPPRRISDVLRTDSNAFDHRGEEIAHRRLALVDDMAARFYEVTAASGENGRELIMQVAVSVGQSASIHNQRLIQQVGIAFLRILHSLQKVGEQFQ